jgi:hypothetical protein
MGLLSVFFSMFGIRREAPSPESQYEVMQDLDGVTLRYPDGKTERVLWDKLVRVSIRTTSDGPVAPDVFWVVTDGEGEILVPQGAIGDQALMEKLQELPGFDSEAVVKAMCCADDKEFLCWEKKRGQA